MANRLLTTMYPPSSSNCRWLLLLSITMVNVTTLVDASLISHCVFFTVVINPFLACRVAPISLRVVCSTSAEFRPSIPIRFQQIYEYVLTAVAKAYHITVILSTRLRSSLCQIHTVYISQSQHAGRDLPYFDIPSGYQ